MARPTRARAIMLQGTSSHVGKTVLVAGLCRLLAQDGFRVAPFKSQNMSLNAHVAPDGGEMGWAQAMQAEAARVPARVEMNPILLKPRADAMSQVVLLGKALRDMPAREYYRQGARLWPAVRSSYAAIAREADVVVIEGAGSPAEPNLMRRDLANMRVAAMAKAPVLLVGDIDRGGVFASLVGTMAILEPPHRRRVAGFVINKFRGDTSLLAPAVRDLERRAHRPVLGVVPYIHDLSLPEEDSVALDGRSFPPASGPLIPTVAIVKLPHIANFTDFAPLESEPGVGVVYARSSGDLAGAALVVLPGSKDTIADLRWLKSRGLDDALAAHVRRGGALLGICGGYQMLGRMVEDPHGVESGGAEAGLALLPIRTTLEPAKVTQRVKARLLPDGPDFEAYEIHAGTTRIEADLVPFCVVAGGAPDGAVSLDGRVRGTYLHGLFEAGAVRRRVLEWAGALPAATTALDHRALRDAGYDRLAQTLREALDLGAVYRLLGLSGPS